MNEYDDLIKYWTKERNLPWHLIKAQIRQESAFKPDARSHCGALGLMQIMPVTGDEIGFSENDLLVPAKNIEAGTLYLKIQFDHFPEIPDRNERLKFSLGAYNGGRGYINRALKLARETGTPNWNEWDITSTLLSSTNCFIITRKRKNLRPDHEQITDYVDKIWKYYQQYLLEENV